MAETLRDRLRRITDEARHREEREAEARVAAEREAAHRLIAQIPELAEEQARVGRNFLVLMDVTYNEQPHFAETGEFTLDPAALTGPSALVYAHCSSEGLTPSLVPRWTSLDTGMHRIDFSLCLSW